MSAAFIALEDGTSHPLTEGSSALVFESTDINEVDSGTGTEGTPGVSQSQTGTGTGTEATPVIAASIPGQTDSGAGTEGVPELAQGAADSGAGTETAGDTTGAVVSTDTGTGTEAGFGSPSTDLGLENTDEVLLEDTDIVLLEGATVGGQVLTAVLSDTDSGAGTEFDSAAVPLDGTDSGSGSDSESTTAELVQADSGAGTEATLVDEDEIGSDSGTGSETETVQVVVAATDDGTGTETEPARALEFFDEGTVIESEDPAILYQDLFDTDSGLGTESAGGPSSTQATWLSLVTKGPRRYAGRPLSGRP